LHSARSSHREQTRNRDFTLDPAASEADLAPLHGAAKRSFGDVIGRLHALVSQKGEEPFKMPQKRQCEIRHVFVAAVEIAPGKQAIANESFVH
jgi:hypothetical protein